MREFTEQETKFIVEHQDDWTLEELAYKYDCEWQEVYEHYSKTIRKNAYKRFMDMRRANKRGGWKTAYYSE